MASKDSPSIYLADLAAYNSGRLHGEWVELDGDADHNLEQIQETIARVLRSSPVADAEEWAIHDYQGFGDLKLGEYEDLEKVAKVAALINEHGAVFAGLVSHFGGTQYLDDAVQSMEESYQGTHDSLEAWAEQYLEDTGALSEVPESLRNYIDFEAWARDAELGGDIFTVTDSEGALHIFWSR